MTVSAKGKLVLPNGEEFTSPSGAALRLFSLQGSTKHAVNGWISLRLGENGPRLSELRDRLEGKNPRTDNEQLRADYWHGLYELCGESQPFVDAFGDPTTRPQNIGWWVSFGIGVHGCLLEFRLGRRDRYADAGIYLPTGMGYRDLYARREEIEDEFGESVNQFLWSEPNDVKKHKALWLRRDFDYDKQDWAEAQTWMRDMLLRLREVAWQTFSDKG